MEKKSALTTNAVGHYANGFLAPFLKTYLRIYSHLPCETVKGVSEGLLYLQYGVNELENPLTSTRTKQPEVEVVLEAI